VFHLDNGKYDSKDNGTAQAPDNGGELWIGLDNAVKNQSVSILFQVADGTANPQKYMSAISWYYLSQNNWIKFSVTDITDDTKGLTISALVSLLIPDNADVDNTRADAGLVWIKLVATNDTDAVCKLIAVRANAAKTVFVQDADKQIQYIQPIPANTISKLSVSNASIKKTEQPYPSFGGYPKETDDTYYIRVSERLRHKKRAITAWDYERLVLDKFPQVYKVKCLNHTGFIFDPKNNIKKYSEVLAGHVMVVTVPDITHADAGYRLFPYTSLGLLQEIQDYLYTYTSPHVQLHVCNPEFEQVQFDFKVTYMDDNNYDNLLNDAIERFLSPWISGNETDLADIRFGETIEKSVVLNFIEKQPYVDFVSCFKMFVYTSDDNNTVQKKEVDEAIPATARSIFVSYYDAANNIKHIINSSETCECNG